MNHPHGTQRVNSRRPARQARQNASVYGSSAGAGRRNKLMRVGLLSRSRRRSWLHLREGAVALGGENKIAFGQALDLVRPDRHPDAAPGEREIGVMVLLLGDRTDAVDQRQRASEVLDAVGLLEMVV